MKRRLVTIVLALLLLQTACAVPAEDKSATSQAPAESLVSLTQETAGQETQTESDKEGEKTMNATQAYPNAA
ncbi:MAG: hypothetical protein IKZ39_07070, partial [Lachnospiraceae bacterium]|nr:hypothetical protein [Lachnospiraceae bacterium]